MDFSYAMDVLGRRFKKSVDKVMWPWNGPQITIFQVIIQCFVYIFLAYIVLMLAIVIYLKINDWVENCRRPGRRPNANQDPENPPEPEAPVAFIGGRTDRRYAGSPHDASESEAILLTHSSDNVKIRILPAQSSSTKNDKKKQAKARAEILPTAGAEVQVTSSAEAGQEVKKSTDGHAKAIETDQQDAHEEAYDQAERASNSSPNCDPYGCSLLACLCEDSGTFHSTPYLPNGFIPSSPFGQGPSARVFSGDSRQYQLPNQSSSENSITAMIEVFGTIASPLSRHNFPARYDDFRYARSAKYLNYYK